MKPLGKVKIEWSPEFAYAIGLITTDGNLSSNGRIINFTSKDEELVKTFAACLQVDNKIGRKARGYTLEKKYYVIQIGDILFYKFLLGIGLMPNKSRSLESLAIPEEYFFDFLRGHFDGDGTFYSYWDSRWHSSYMFYTVFLSASKNHILWLQQRIHSHLGITGHITGHGKKGTCYQLKYGKSESLQLLRRLYYDKGIVCLSRKRIKVEKALAVEGMTINARVL